MRYYAGLDISKKTTAICVLDEEKNIIVEGEVLTTTYAIVEFLEANRLSYDKLGLESGSWTRRLVIGLREAGYNAICVDARRMNGILKQEVNKTDKNDARGIANAMRADMYQEVHIKSELSVEMNTLLATRAAHVEQQKQLIATIRGLLKSYAISPDAFNKSNASFVLECHRDDLPKDVYQAFSLSLDALESISKAVREIEKLIKKAMANNEDAALLQTMPGVGPIVAAKFLAILDDPERFKDGRQFAAYLGLTPKQYSSGEVQRMGRISKCGDSDLRSLLFQSAVSEVYRSEKWSYIKAWAMRLSEGKKKTFKQTMVAVARKKAVVLFHMLKTRKPFRYGKKKEALDKGKAAA